LGYDRELAFLEKSGIDCIENCKNCNRNYKVYRAANFECDIWNAEEVNDVFKKPKNDPINHKNEETKSDKHKRKSNEL